MRPISTSVIFLIDGEALAMVRDRVHIPHFALLLLLTSLPNTVSASSRRKWLCNHKLSPYLHLSFQNHFQSLYLLFKIQWPNTKCITSSNSRSMFSFTLFLFLRYWNLNSGPTPWATPHALFCDGFCWDRVEQTICPGWLQTAILLISASWVARTTVW
jgi:hypothetical protein